MGRVVGFKAARLPLFRPPQGSPGMRVRRVVDSLHQPRRDETGPSFEGLGFSKAPWPDTIATASSSVS